MKKAVVAALDLELWQSGAPTLILGGGMEPVALRR